MTDLQGGANKVAEGVNKAGTAIATVEQALVALGPQIAVADMLVHLGITTVAKVRGYFATKTTDDQILAGIMNEVDARIARRA